MGVIRKVSEPVGEGASGQAARRNNDFIDPRLVELKSPDHNVTRPTGSSPVWVKRQQQTQEAPAVISSAKGSGSGGASDAGDGGSGSKDAGAGQLQPERRPRSGTWSVANSRRVKIKQEKEEDASLRVRRKSGDDILNASSSSNGSNVASNRRKEGGPQGFFDSFRPRSKSDARAIMASRQRRKSG